MYKEDSKLKEDFFQWKVDYTELGKAGLSVERQTAVLAATLDSQTCQDFPPDFGFRVSFCKRLIKGVEEQGEEVVEELYSHLTQLLAGGEDQGKHSYKTYFIGGTSISLIESKEIISNGTTGLSTWTAGISLAEWIKQQGEQLLAGKTVLELGAGTGVTGLLALNTCPSLREYTFTDCHQSVLENLRLNVRSNLPAADQSRARVEHLDWEQQGEEGDRNTWPDIVLGADIVFDTRVIPSLVATLHHLLAPGSATGYIAATVRNADTNQFFLETLSKCGSLDWEETELTLEPLPVKLYKIRRKDS